MPFFSRTAVATGRFGYLILSYYYTSCMVYWAGERERESSKHASYYSKYFPTGSTANAGSDRFFMYGTQIHADTETERRRATELYE